MTHETVTLRLPQLLLSDAKAVARNRDLTLGELIRQYLDDEVHVEASPREQRFAATLSRLEHVFARARCWVDLKTALAKRGHYLRAHGTGLAIYAGADDTFLCNTARVGHRYRNLVKRFGAPMPGHPHGMDWVVPAASMDILKNANSA